MNLTDIYNVTVGYLAYNCIFYPLLWAGGPLDMLFDHLI